MKNDTPDNRELEKLLRNKLQGVDQNPDPDIWSKIAARQSGLNRWLQWKHYGLWYGLPAALLVAGFLGWQHFRHTSASPAVRPAREQLQRGETPIAALPTPPPAGASASAPTNAPAARNPAAQGAAWKRLNTVPATSVRFLSETGIRYENPATGTQVNIPAGILVDAAGRPVRGEVELLLREYRDISDFLASGIPMHYGDERGEYFFNSGGMFDVRVSQGGEPLRLAPGESYEVLFSPTGELVNASLFYLNDDTGAWEYRPGPTFSRSPNRQPEAAPPVVAENLAVRNNRQNNKLPCLPQLPELPAKADPVEWVNEGILTGQALASESMKMPLWFRRNPHLNTEALLTGLERGRVRMVRNIDRGELFFPEDLDNFFTELKAFKGCYFQRSTDSISQTAPAPTPLDPNMQWDRISVKQELNNEVFISLYSDREGLLQFYATLSASFSNKNFKVEAVMAEYQRLRTERLQNFERMVNQLHRFLFVAPMFQTEQEWCMSTVEWLEYFEQQRPLMRKRYEALVAAGLGHGEAATQDAWSKWKARVRELYFNKAEAVLQAGNMVRGKSEAMQYALRVSQFGTYNCDQIFRLGTSRAPEYVYATYESERGERVYASTVSVLEKNTRLFFTLPRADQLIRAPGRALDVIVTDRQGRQFHLQGSDYARIDLEGLKTNHFVVKDITDKTRSPRDWAAYLDL